MFLSLRIAHSKIPGFIGIPFSDTQASYSTCFLISTSHHFHPLLPHFHFSTQLLQIRGDVDIFHSFSPLSNVFSSILTSDLRSKTSSTCPPCPTTGCCPSAAAPCTTAAPAPWRRCVAPGSRRRCFLWPGLSRGGQSIWSRWDRVLRQISWRFF